MVRNNFRLHKHEVTDENHLGVGEGSNFKGSHSSK